MLNASSQLPKAKPYPHIHFKLKTTSPKEACQISYRKRQFELVYQLSRIELPIGIEGKGGKGAKEKNV